MVAGIGDDPLCCLIMELNTFRSFQRDEGGEENDNKSKNKNKRDKKNKNKRKKMVMMMKKKQRWKTEKKAKNGITKTKHNKKKLTSETSYCVD